MHNVGSPEFDGDSGIKGLQMANGAGLAKYAWSEGGMIGILRGESTTSRHTGIDVEQNWGPALPMDEEDAISVGQEVVKPVQVLF